MAHTYLPPIAQGDRATLHAKLREHDDALNTLEGAGASAQLEEFQAVNGEVVAMTRGQVVATHDGQIYLASCYSQLLASVQGLVVVGAGATLPVTVQEDGVVTLTTAEWDSVTGGSGGLTPGARYYLDTAGKITTTAPTAPGTFVTPIGRAITSTILALRITPYIQN